MVAMDHTDEYEDYGAYNRLGESPPTICSLKIPIYGQDYISIVSGNKSVRLVVRLRTAKATEVDK